MPNQKFSLPVIDTSSLNGTPLRLDVSICDKGPGWLYRFAGPSLPQYCIQEGDWLVVEPINVVQDGVLVLACGRMAGQPPLYYIGTLVQLLDVVVLRLPDGGQLAPGLSVQGRITAVLRSY
jgi:hypothetical protein